MKEEQAKVKNAAGHGFAVNQHMFFIQMPAPGPDDQCGRIVDQLIVLALGRGKIDVAVDRIPEIDLTVDAVFPGRGIGIFKVGHEGFGSGV